MASLDVEADGSAGTPPVHVDPGATRGAKASIGRELSLASSAGLTRTRIVLGVRGAAGVSGSAFGLVARISAARGAQRER